MILYVILKNSTVVSSKGQIIAYLDADDSWSPGYLSRLVPIARHEGCAFAPTIIENNNGDVLLRVPGEAQDRLMLSDFASWGASFHPVHAAGLPRGTASGPFWNAPAQDVMHAVEVFMACGLTAALETSVAYRLRLGSETVTTASDFSSRLRAAYAAYDQALAETWAQTLKCLRADGRMLTCGATIGFDPPTDIRYIWTYEQRIIGSNGWMPDEQVALLDLVALGGFDPVIDRVLPLERLHEGMQALIDRKVFGKVVIEIASPN